jgi:hypothetical protein
MIEKLGADCALDAVENGDPDPHDVDGRCLLPMSPLPMDWAALRAFLGRVPTVVEEVLFVQAWRRARPPCPQCGAGVQS